MALRNYVVEVLGSKATVRVLKALLTYRGKTFTIRELARTAGLSHPGVSKAAKELERRGIVRLQPVGRAQQVSLNEESYVLKSLIEPLFKAEERTLESLISTIRPFFDDEKISSVAIFGSVAAGKEGGSSDVDLLVVTRDRKLAYDRVARAGAVTLSKFGIALSPLVLAEKDFARRHDRELGKSILRSYMLVSGRDLKETVGNVKDRR
ncbi:MAG: MarR family transcriptional regulator [Nitrososphaerota archaeon]|nr:MarR family transcriptional regulator [Nitrososphaerota archaeon]